MTDALPGRGVRHSGPDMKFCVLCLSGEHERADAVHRTDDTALGRCGCGEPSTPGTTHRVDRPCYAEAAKETQ